MLLSLVSFVLDKKISIKLINNKILANLNIYIYI